MMVAKTKISFFVCGACFFSLLSVSVSQAENIEKNTARMQAMDKITGRVNVIDIPVGGKTDFGTFSVVVRSCQTRSAEEIPDNFAFVDVTDKDFEGKESNIFKGWMISSSPATSAVEHPIYDVWLLKCIDKKIDKTQLLSEEELTLRDNLPKISASDKKKIVSDSILEMNYENEESPLVSSIKENTALEFEMDEEASEENFDETGESSDEKTDESSSTEIMNIENSPDTEF